MATFLEIIQACTAELGLPQVSTVSGNQNGTVRQLAALANRSGDELYQSHPWIVSQEYHIVEIGSPIDTTGDVVAGGTTITNIPSTAGIVANQFAITGNTFQQSTRVIDVIDGTSIEIDQPPLQGGIGVELVIARDTFAVPDDFKWFANQTMWDRTNHWQLVGPMSPQADQWMRSGIVPTGPRRRWRQVGADPVNWRLWPPPTAANDYPATLVFEYNSKYWASTAGGVRKQWMTDDTDFPVIDAQAIILHTKWRWLQAKNMAYAPQQAEALDFEARLAARDGGSPDLSLAKNRGNFYLINTENIADGNWPGPGNTGNP